MRAEFCIRWAVSRLRSGKSKASCRTDARFPCYFNRSPAGGMTSEPGSADLIDFTAAVAVARGAPFAISPLRMEPLRQDEVLVHIVATGVCATDAHSRDQEMPVPLPAVLGHEGAGIVTVAGSAVTGVAPGNHVILTFPSCGSCRQCRLSAPANCLQGFALSFGCVRADGSSAYDRVLREAAVPSLRALAADTGFDVALAVGSDRCISDQMQPVSVKPQPAPRPILSRTLSPILRP